MMSVSGLLSQGYAADPKINLQALMAKRVPVLLEFGRGWCIPCKYMKPILDDMSTAYAGKAIVMTVDMDANKDLVRNFKVRMMPTQIFLMPDGKEFLETKGPRARSNRSGGSARWAWTAECKVLLGSSSGGCPRPLPRIRMPPGKGWNKWRRMDEV
jgi:thioredoxin 1